MSRAEKIYLTICGSMLVVFLVAGLSTASAATSHEAPPRAAQAYRADLVRTAHSVWGLDAPVPMFAAQIHQESGWNPGAVSKVGARGMAQFMPTTAAWWCSANRMSIADCQPSNPVWSMRALVGYDRWHYDRVPGASEYDRLWAALRGYNGGLGHWQREAALAKTKVRVDIDAECGHANRAAIYCAENLGYPHRILDTLQPIYGSWGRTVRQGAA